MASVKGKILFVTGAASGIGRATARKLMSLGARVALSDLNCVAMEKDMRDFKGDFSIHKLDVTNRNEVRDVIQDIKRRYGKLDGCANIAGVIGKGSNVLPIWDVSSEEYVFTMDVNTKGVFNCLAEQLKPGVLEETSSIVNMASVAGVLGLAKNAPYCASKFAVVGLTKSSAKDAGARSIRVNCISPGAIQTPLLEADEFSRTSSNVPGSPIGRVGQPEEVANLVTFLLSDESKFITGSNYNIDGGWQC